MRNMSYSPLNIENSREGCADFSYLPEPYFLPLFRTSLQLDSLDEKVFCTLNLFGIKCNEDIRIKIYTFGINEHCQLDTDIKINFKSKKQAKYVFDVNPAGKYFIQVSQGSVEDCLNLDVVKKLEQQEENRRKATDLFIKQTQTFEAPYKIPIYSEIIKEEIYKIKDFPIGLSGPTVDSFKGDTGTTGAIGTQRDTGVQGVTGAQGSTNTDQTDNKVKIDDQWVEIDDIEICLVGQEKGYENPGGRNSVSRADFENPGGRNSVSRADFENSGKHNSVSRANFEDKNDVPIDVSSVKAEYSSEGSSMVNQIKDSSFDNVWNTPGVCSYTSNRPSLRERFRKYNPKKLRKD